MTSATYQSVGTLVASTAGTMVVPVNPAGLSVGDGLIVWVTWHDDAGGGHPIACSTPGHGLTTLVDSIGTAAILLTDNGRTSAALFWREVDGTEPANYTFNTPGVPGSFNGGAMGQAVRVSKPSGFAFQVVGVGGDDPAVHSASSAVLGSLNLAVDDLCLVVHVKSTDAGGPGIGHFGSEALTGAGLTFSAAVEIQEASTAVGFDQGAQLWRTSVATGSATVTPTASATIGGTAKPTTVALARIRVVAVPPGVPTSVAADPAIYSASLSWAAPATGGSPDGYRVRRDGGASTDLDDTDLASDFTGLTPATDYDLEVQAFNVGGASAWVTVTTTTLEAPAIPYYRVDLTLGDHEWSIVSADAPAYGPLLPMTLGWDIPDGVDFFPAQPNLTTLGFDVQGTDASEFADVVKGSPVTFRMWVDPTADPDVDDPWQSLDGVVTQLDGAVIDSATDPDGVDFRLTVFAADDTARLIDMPVGYTDDWPLETIADRLDRICDEAGIVRGADGVSAEVGMVGWLRARDKGAPLSALTAIRDTLKDSADHDASSDPGHDWYGRYVYTYDLATNTLVIRVFRRRLFAAGVQQTTLNGGIVRVAGRWTKAPGPAAATWGLVNDTVFGTPDAGPPFVRSASLVGLLDGAPNGDSATELTNLGNSLLPDGSTALDGWATRVLTYLAYLDPDPVARWVSLPASGDSYLVKPVIITPIGPELELNAVDYVAGTLAGARLVIPPGGRFYVEVRLRAELLPGTILP